MVGRALGGRAPGKADPFGGYEVIMDVRYINAFISSISNVFKTMLNTEVSVGKPLLKETEMKSADVSGVIGLSGGVQGCVVLSFPLDVACKLATAFAGAELGPDDPDFADAIGELTNMVAGNAKKDFPGVHASISLPSVITGEGHTVSQSRSSPFLVIPCETGKGSFNVEVALIEKKKESSTVSAAAVGATE
jgi:chemotaxis protein CheX